MNALADKANIYFDSVSIFSADEDSLRGLAFELDLLPSRIEQDGQSGLYKIQSTLPDAIDYLISSATPDVIGAAEMQTDTVRLAWEDGIDLYFKWRTDGSPFFPMDAFLPLPLSPDQTWVGIRAQGCYWELPMHGKNWGRMIFDYWDWNSTPNGELDFGNRDFLLPLSAQDLKLGISEWMPSDREALISAITSLDDQISEGDVLELWGAFQFRIHTTIGNVNAFRQDLWHSLASALH